MISIKEFREGTFILEFYDIDLVNYPIEIKLITPPSTIKILDESFSEGVIKFIELKSVDDLSALEVSLLIKNVKFINDISNVMEPLSNQVNYSPYIDAYSINTLMNKKGASSILIELPGLNLLVKKSDNYSIMITSDMFFYGTHNKIIGWYLSLIKRYINLICTT